MRNKFDSQLEKLNLELITMGALCEDAISASVKGFLDDDDALCRKAVEAEDEINRKERDIESICMKLLLEQQPVARDLRVISSAVFLSLLDCIYPTVKFLSAKALVPLFTTNIHSSV